MIARRAVYDGQLGVDPTSGLKLPRIRGRRDHVVGPAEAAALLRALPVAERALWATALYAGLRRGELRAMRWSDVDFDAGEIRVERAWDDVEGVIDVKSDAGRRRVPIVGALRKIIAEHKLATGRYGDALVFGRTPELPFVVTTVTAHTRKAWKAENARRLKAHPDTTDLLDVHLTLHEGCHCAVSYMLAADLNMKQIQTYVGHSDIRTTLNQYGHLLPDDTAGTVKLLDAFYEAAR